MLHAERRSREGGLEEQLRIQSAPMHALPYRDGIFDVSIGELGLTAGAAPDQAVAELARVTRAGGTVVLVQLAWTAPVSDAKQRELSELLGFSPRPLVDWKRQLQEHGIEGLYTEQWSEGSNALRSVADRPVPGLTSGFSLRERLDVTRRAWKRWGLRGAVGAWGEGGRLQRVLERERVLHLVILKGTRTAPPNAELDSTDEAASKETPKPTDVSDLPLFGNGAHTEP